MFYFLAVIAAVLAAERFIKGRIRSLPPEELPRSFAGGHIRLTHTENTGFSASYLRHRSEVVQVVSAAGAAIAFVTFLPELIRRGRDKAYLLGAGLLFGGSLSNLFDRTFRGAVTDYISFPKAPRIRRLVFNLADFCIFLGAALVLLRSLFGKKK